MRRSAGSSRRDSSRNRAFPHMPAHVRPTAKAFSWRRRGMAIPSNRDRAYSEPICLNRFTSSSPWADGAPPPDCGSTAEPCSTASRDFGDARSRRSVHGRTRRYHRSSPAGGVPLKREHIEWLASDAWASFLASDLCRGVRRRGRPRCDRAVDRPLSRRTTEPVQKFARVPATKSMVNSRESVTTSRLLEVSGTTLMQPTCPSETPPSAEPAVSSCRTMSPRRSTRIDSSRR